MKDEDRIYLSHDEAADVQANKFALCLLLPAEQFRQSCARHKLDALDDKTAKAIADEFRVTIGLVYVRAAMLGMLDLWEMAKRKKERLILARAAANIPQPPTSGDNPIAS